MRLPRRKPIRRIVLNACLTASNVVQPKVSSAQLAKKYNESPQVVSAIEFDSGVNSPAPETLVMNKCQPPSDGFALLFRRVMNVP